VFRQISIVFVNRFAQKTYVGMARHVIDLIIAAAQYV